MNEFEHHPIHDPGFFGRKKELDWLRDRIVRRHGSGSPIFITGVGGIGKTALVKHFLASSRISSVPFWVNLNTTSASNDDLDRFIEELYSDIPRNPFVAVLDGAEFLSENQIRHVVGRIYNIKATRGLIFIARKAPTVERAEYLNLTNLPDDEASELITSLMENGLDSAQVRQALNISAGHPLALSLLSSLLKSGDHSSIDDLLSGRVYEFSTGIALPQPEIITAVKPRIISATDHMVAKLRKQPRSIYNLEPRQFEELLAHLLTDMGWEVELTKATGDGGKDILAYLDTEVGKMLCLVEAKRYREDRKVGVDLVRSLYGTLYDHRASSAMLVTTSSFTAGAKEFQQRYEYQLALRDYGDIVQWIQNYKR